MKIVLAVKGRFILVFWKENMEFVVATKIKDCQVGDFVNSWQWGHYFKNCNDAVEYFKEETVDEPETEEA